MPDRIREDIAALAGIEAVPTILATICRTTGMGVAAVARVTEDRWIACSTRDEIAFGLNSGGELPIEATLCREIRQRRKPIVVDNFVENPDYRDHPAPQIYRLQSYISVPIIVTGGRFFGTLCAFDPAPHLLNTPETISMFEMFADVIGFYLGAIDKAAEAEAQLAAARETSALREQFIAILGHDLRNPLTGVLGGMEMLQKNPLNERATQWAHMVVASANRMAELIDTVMDFSRSRLGGGLPLERGMHDTLESVLRQIVTGSQSGRMKRDIDLVIDVPVPVNCDLRRLAQLASYLLGNALNNGDPEAPLKVHAIAADGWFELSVANRGTTIPAALLPEIFEPFSLGSREQSREGLGLGLYMSHQIALAHGGDLIASSTPEETRFTFRMEL